MFKIIFLLLYCIASLFTQNQIYADDAKGRQNSIEQAAKLYSDGQIAGAAIAYHEIQTKPYINPQDRITAQTKFSACLENLKSNIEQTDKLGDMILSLENRDQMLSLLQTYAFILDAQGRVDKSIGVYRWMYKVWPSDAQKYSLAKKLENSNQTNESIELYIELLENHRYHNISLNRILEMIKNAKDGNKYLSQIINQYRKEVMSSYDMTNLAIDSLVYFKRPADALEFGLDMVLRYPQSTDILAYKLSPIYKDISLENDKTGIISKLDLRALSEEQLCLMAKIYDGSGDSIKALRVLSAKPSKKTIEYKAELLFNSENYKEARQTYEFLMAKYAPTQFYYQKLGEIALREGNDKLALEYFNNYLNFNSSKNYSDYFFVGRTLEQYGLTEEAEKIYLEGKNLSSGESFAQIEMVKYYLAQRKYSIAAKELIHPLKSQRFNLTELLIAIKYASADKTDIAKLARELIVIAEEKEKLQNTNKILPANLYFCAMTLYEETGDINNAVKCMEKYFGLYPEKRELKLIEFCDKISSKGYLNETNILLSMIPSGSLYYEQAVAKRSEALICLNKPIEAELLIKSIPNLINSCLYAKTLYMAGKTKEAENILSKINLKTPEFYLLQGDIALSKKMFDDAVKNYSIVSAQSDELSVQSSFNTALASIFSGKYKEASAILERISSEHPQSPEINKVMEYRKIIALLSLAGEGALNQWAGAEFFFFIRDYESAQKEYSALINANPQAGYSLYLRLKLFELFKYTNRDKESIKVLEDIEKFFPESVYAPFSAYNIIGLRGKSGERFDVIGQYTSLLEKYPDSFEADLARNNIDIEKQKKEPDNN